MSRTGTPTNNSFHRKLKCVLLFCTLLKCGVIAAKLTSYWGQNHVSSAFYHKVASAFFSRPLELWFLWKKRENIGTCSRAVIAESFGTIILPIERSKFVWSSFRKATCGVELKVHGTKNEIYLQERSFLMTQIVWIIAPVFMSNGGAPTLLCWSLRDCHLSNYFVISWLSIRQSRRLVSYRDFS